MTTSTQCPRSTQVSTQSQSAVKTVLRIAFESIAGERSDRQWRRIKLKLNISDDLKGRALMEALPVVRTYAYLRLKNGNQLVTLEDVYKKLWLDEFARGLNATLSGRDLVESFKRLTPSPAISTIRMWGYEIDCHLHMDRWYAPEEVKRWIAKVGSQAKFKFDPKNTQRKIGA